MKRIDLNCDMGEMPEAISDGTQESLMPYLTSVSIACGGHAGDAQTMKATIEQALRWKLAVGAHPGYPDRANFGRLELNLPPEAIADSVFEQVRALAEIAAGCGASVTYVKPHGALYNQAATNRVLGPSDCRWGRSLEPGRRTRGPGWIADAGCLSRSWLPSCRGSVCRPAVRSRWHLALAEIRRRADTRSCGGRAPGIEHRRARDRGCLRRNRNRRERADHLHPWGHSGRPENCRRGRANTAKRRHRTQAVLAIPWHR